MTAYSSKLTDSIRGGVFKIIKSLSGTTNETDQIIGLDEFIWRDIEEGLVMCGGFTYSLYDQQDGMPSLEEDYKRYYKGKEPNKQDLATIFGLLVTELFPNYIEDNTELTLSEDGKSFYIKLKDFDNNY